MATIGDLTAQQRDDFARYDVFIRGLFSSLARVAKDANPAFWHAFAQQRINTPLASLDAQSAIPNSSGLGGAIDLTASEFLAAQTLADQLSVLFQTNLSLLVKLCGVNAG